MLALFVSSSLFLSISLFDFLPCGLSTRDTVVDDEP